MNEEMTVIERKQEDRSQEGQNRFCELNRTVAKFSVQYNTSLRYQNGNCRQTCYISILAMRKYTAILRTSVHLILILMEGVLLSELVITAR